MRNLLIFISKYNAFFLFLIFEISSLVIYIKYNSFQKATFLTSSNEITGRLNTQVNRFYRYLALNQINDSLAAENARLRNQLKSSFYVDTLTKKTITDSVFKQQYTYLNARVISNSTNLRSNYITIDKGSKDGIAKGMGVISGSGVVGYIINTSLHFSTVQSLLNKDAIVSAMLADTKDRGLFKWGDDLDPRKGLLYDVANNAQPKLKQLVVTSGYSLWPAGIPIGRISNLNPKNGGTSLNMEVTFAVDFGKLQYVDVVINKLATEQAGLEAQQKKNE